MLQSVNQANFTSQVIESEKLVLVDFWSPTCGPCTLLNTVLEDLAKDLKSKIEIVKVNVDKEFELANEQAIIIMPTLKIFRNGQCIKDIFGVHTKDDLLAAIETLSPIKL